MKLMRSAAVRTPPTVPLFGNSSASEWQALAKHVARIRQLRRKGKLTYERLAVRAQKDTVKLRAVAWRSLGRWVCRHGAFWLKAQGRRCPCMLETSAESNWRNARLMGKLDHDLQSLVAVPFEHSTFVHVAALRAEYARQQW